MNYQTIVFWWILAHSVLFCLCHATTTLPFNLLQLLSLPPTVHPSTRMVNRRSTYAYLVRHRPVRHPLIGADFLSHNSLVVDVALPPLELMSSTTLYLVYFIFGLQMMDQIFGHLPNCKVYIDGILIASENHREHFRSVLELLHINVLVIRKDKCVFGASAIDFLGHDISGDGIRPLPSKGDAVSKFPKPTTVKQLQEFLGMIKYYHRFIHNAAGILSPLYRLSSSKHKELEGWTATHKHSFLAAKEALAQAATLATPTNTDKLYLLPMPATLP